MRTFIENGVSLDSPVANDSYTMASLLTIVNNRYSPASPATRYDIKPDGECGLCQPLVYQSTTARAWMGHFLSCSLILNARKALLSLTLVEDVE